MAAPLLDIFAHNSWATRRLLVFCQDLDANQLHAEAPGVFGGPLETLKHLLDAESFYQSMFAALPDEIDRWRASQAALAISDLLPWSTRLAEAWGSLLSDAAIDPERLLVLTRADGTTRTHRAGMLLAQTIHHGNVHREQVSSILTSLGLTPPDLSGYAYERER